MKLVCDLSDVGEEAMSEGEDQTLFQSYLWHYKGLSLVEFRSLPVWERENICRCFGDWLTVTRMQEYPIMGSGCEPVQRGGRGWLVAVVVLLLSGLVLRSLLR